MKEFTGYQCDHCSKLYKSKYHCNNHELNKCTHNPKNWDRCLGCIFSQQFQETIEVDSEHPYYGYQEFYEKTVTKYKCKKLEKEMYPFKAHAKNLPKRFPDTFKGIEQMPYLRSSGKETAFAVVHFCVFFR
jgi:hypothetical protein